MTNITHFYRHPMFRLNCNSSIFNDLFYVRLINNFRRFQILKNEKTKKTIKIATNENQAFILSVQLVKSNIL